MKKTRVVIVGAGFAGLWAAKKLAGSGVDVLMVDRNNYHTFPPLLYQVAASEIAPEEIAFPIRSILPKMKGVRFGMYEVSGIDLDAKLVKTSCRDFEYDYLVMALGSAAGFLGIEGAEEHSFPLKTLEHAVELRNHILRLFESASCDVETRLECMSINIVIVGGGPTGIEYAGALLELVRGPLSSDYPDLDCRKVKIILLEAAEKLVPELDEKSSEYILSRLAKMGVEVRLGSFVSKVTPTAVFMKDGSSIQTETVVWTAGVRGIPEAKDWGLPVGKGGRVPVLPTLQVPNHPEAYVVGDMAYVESGGHPLPLTAPVAIQEGTAAAANILNQTQGEQPEPFNFHDKGFMVTIGRKLAVASIRGKTFFGIPAWMMWLGVHIFNLIGFHNRIFVLIHWARDYFFHDKSVRLILGAKRTSSD